MQEDTHEPGVEPKSAPHIASQDAASDPAKSSASKRIFQVERRYQLILRDAIIKIRQGDWHSLTVQDVFEVAQCHNKLIQRAALSDSDLRLKGIIDDCVKTMKAKVNLIPLQRIKTFIRQTWPD